MDRKTIGAFLAVLRKANGMTQQQVADRLNISNKTVSKWERDESLPDLMLIPALAEMFHVTADEILRGQRMEQTEAAQERQTEKTHLQARAIIARTMNRHLNWITGAAAMMAAGIVALFTVSYAFYKPVLGFGIFLVMLLAGLVTAFLATNTAKTALTGGEMIDETDALAAEVRLQGRMKNLMQAAVAALIFALPVALVRSYVYTNSVISWETYLALMPMLAAVSALIVMLVDWLCMRIWPGLRMEYYRTRRRLARLYVCAAAAMIMVVAGTAAIDSTDKWVEVIPQREFVIHFPDREAAEEYRAAVEDYAAGGEAWYDYCAENMGEYGLPWNAEMDEADRELLVEHGFLKKDVALEDTEGNEVPIGRYYMWAFEPNSVTADGLSASFEMHVYRDESASVRFNAVFFLIMGTALVIALTVAGRRRTLRVGEEQTEMKELTEKEGTAEE